MRPYGTPTFHTKTYSTLPAAIKAAKQYRRTSGLNINIKHVVNFTRDGQQVSEWYSRTTGEVSELRIAYNGQSRWEIFTIAEAEKRVTQG